MRLKLAGALAVGSVVVLLVPQTGTGDGAPPMGTLLASGFLVGVVMLGALYLTLTRDLRLPSTVIVYAVTFNALVIIVKFVLAPNGVYEVTAYRCERIGA